MSENIHQIYLANPITTNASTDLMYFGQSPYGAGNDAAMTYANFSAQIVSAGLANQIAYYATSGSTLSGITVVNNGVLITSNAGVPSLLANGTAGYVLTANSGAPPTWEPVASEGAITTIDGDAGSITPTAGVVTISGSSTGLTTSGSGSTMDLTGTLAIGHGGTSVTSVTTSPTATAFAGWDANKNLSANNFLAGYATTATAASTTTLTVGSTYQQFFTGSTTQTVVMPVTSTLVLGQSWLIANNSSGVVTVQSSGNNNIIALPANTQSIVTCILTSGTTAASWSASSISDTPFPISLADGGTNASLVASDGGIFYSTATAGAILSGTATAGQLLISGSNAAPAWTTSTYPSTNAINTLLYASSANVMAALATANSATLVTSGAGVPSWQVLTAGQILVGTTASAPAATTITSGSGINVTSSSGSITISATGGGIAWASIAGTSQAAAVNTGYIVANAGQTTVTLPATAAIGDTVKVRGLGAAGWILAANTGQTVKYVAATTSSGGSLTSAEQYDTVDVTCIVANTTWSVSSASTTGLTVA